MSGRNLLSTSEAAEYLRRPKRTLDQWRHLRQGPAYLKVGGHVLYDLADLDEWLDSQRVTPGAA